MIRVWKANRLKEISLFGIRLNIEGNTFYNNEKDVRIVYKEGKYVLLKKGRKQQLKIDLKRNKDIIVWILIYSFFLSV